MRATRGDIGRLAAAVTLLVVAALGASARRGTRLSAAGLIGPGTNAVTQALGLILVAIACAVLAALAVTLARRARRRRDDEPQEVPEPAGTRWQRAAALIAALTMIALLGAAVVLVVRRARHPRAAPAGPIGGTAPRLPVVTHAHGAVAVLVPAVLVAAVAVLLALAVVVLARHRRERARAAGGAGREATPPEPLTAAALAGEAALRAGRDARSAIIACYAAMEGALADAGSPRRAADTPDELLERAVGGGIVGPAAAGRLTGLFREARFSPHPMSEGHRAAAGEALGEILAAVPGARTEGSAP